MTVQGLLRTYFSLGSKFQSISAQKNDGGKLKNLYSSNNGYVEQYMRPEVRVATVMMKRIWITVE